ncbi:MAG: hypothetical protein DWQ30_24815 [Acidobacteria bacterium]|nr:MAG: hypothetical protein DWQ30_24815 [Acidobacteriota bacterium]
MRPRRCAPLGGLLVLAVTLAAAPAVAQKIGVGQTRGGGAPEGPPIVAIHATVEDMATKKEIGIVERGGHFEVQEGQQVRLRLVAEAAGDRRRFPSTRFEVNSESRHIYVDKLNPEVGAVILTGGRPNSRGGAVPVQYEILENLNVGDDLRTGRFYLDIVPQRTQQPRPEPKPEPTPQLGVTLYSDAGYRGASTRFLASDRDLHDDAVGNDRVSSIRVDPGCTVTVFEHPNYGGVASTFTEDVYGMDGTRVGNDAVSSLRLECSTQARRGVTLYSDGYFEGVSAFFSGDVANLGATDFGNDRASSIRVDQGCEVTIFADVEFRGRYATFRDTLPLLNGTPVGNDAVSSLRVRCD